MTTVIIGLAVVAVLALIALAVYNDMIRARNKVDEAWSGIDVQLTRRHDLIPNLVDTVKAYAAHERATLEQLALARMRAVVASGPAAAGPAEQLLGDALTRLLATIEAYPELRASESFRQLQDELANTEDQIAAARRIYNGNVQSYNTKIQVFPSSLIAELGGFEPRDFFDLGDPGAHEPVPVELDDLSVRR